MVESPTSVPADPTGLTATAIGDLTIAISWTDSSTVEEGYILEWGPDNIRWETLVRLGADADSYKKSGLKEGMTYWFRVKAFNKAGESDYSNSDSAIAVLIVKR